MDILRIKDPNTGEWITVPALKGEKGDNGKDAVTDQTYDPDSKNAQSGIAVAEAINSTVGDISAALDELHAYAQNLVNGGAN